MLPEYACIFKKVLEALSPLPNSHLRNKHEDGPANLYTYYPSLPLT